MSIFPSIGLYNRLPALGDNVLLAGIATSLSKSFQQKVHIVCQHPELYENHPEIVGVPLDGSGGLDDLRLIDMTESIMPFEPVGDMRHRSLSEQKLARMCTEAGLSSPPREPARLYLSEEEKATARQLRGFLSDKCVGVVLESTHPAKTWPYTRWLIRHFRRRGWDVFAICERARARHRYLTRYGVHSLIGKSLRQVLVYLSMMDLLIGSDTGPMHMGLALGVPGIVIGLRYFQDLYQAYDNCEFVLARGPDFSPRLALASVSLSSISKRAETFVANKTVIGMPSIITKRKNRIALMLLEGLGGTVTLSDTAKKVHERTGEQPYLVVRKHPELFANNPHVQEVITVGMESYERCVPDLLVQFDTLAVIKTGVGKWYQQNGKPFEQDFREWEDFYEHHPMGTRQLERYGLNLIQTANRSLGLPFEVIESQIYNYADPDVALPPEYIVVSNGVDTWHQGMKQTKSWDHEKWEEVTELLSLPVVQVGTGYDIAIAGAIDLRTRTTIPQLLSVMRDSRAILCTEGGLMHLGYAIGNANTFAIRGPTRGCFFHYPGQHTIDSYVCHQCYWDTAEWYALCPKNANAVCMSSITAARVARRLEKVLNANMAENAQFTSL